MSTTDAIGRRYFIAEVSRRTGFSPTALRYYERAGVVAPPDRTAAGYRVYDDRAVERLRLVARAKELGCTLEEISGLVEAWDTDDCGPVKHRLRSLVAGKVAEIEHHIAEQHALATQLRTLATGLASRPVDGPCNDTCGCSSTAATETVTLGDGPSAAPAIACTLAGGEVEDRVGEWQGLLRTATRQAIPDGVRLLFAPPAPVAEIARLVEAEHACCSFLTFTMTVDPQDVSLDVTAPAEGQAMVDAVFGTAP